MTENITVDGKTLAVTTNLASALRYVKKHLVDMYPDRDPASFRFGSTPSASTSRTRPRGATRSPS